jgi:tetratricopeptide (TPR) repeat protein
VVSAFEATLRRRYFAAFQAGRRAKNKHQRLLKLDPSFADAYLVLGTYDYTLATLPRSVRFLVLLIGIRGSKEKGVKLIRKAAQEGRRAEWGARLLLTVMDTREKRYGTALATLSELEAAFPKNPLFSLERGWVYLLKKDWANARAVFQKLRANQELQVPHYEQVPTPLLYLRLGESYLFDSRFSDALERFDAGLAIAGCPESTRAMLHLRRGQALDGLSKRQEARAEYQETIRLNVDKASRRQARRYLKAPFRIDN